MSSREHQKTDWVRLVPVTLWTVLIALLSLIRFSPPREVPTLFEHLDKVAHFAMYGVYAFIILRSDLIAERGRPARRIVFTVLWAIAYGFLIECIQGAIPLLGRQFSMLDVAANVTGVGTGVWIWSGTHRGRIGSAPGIPQR